METHLKSIDKAFLAFKIFKKTKNYSLGISTKKALTTKK